MKQKHGHGGARAVAGGKKTGLSRKETRKLARQEKKQRRVGPASQSVSAKAASSSRAMKTEAGGKRARDGAEAEEHGAKKLKVGGGDRKSVGLLAKAKARLGKRAAPQGLSQGGTHDVASVKAETRKRPLSALDDDALVRAEEEELKYLERKLGLTGADKKKAEQRLLRDLQRCEGFDDDFLGLLKDVDRISKVVREGKPTKSNKSAAAETSGKARVSSKAAAALVDDDEEDGDLSMEEGDYEYDLEDEESEGDAMEAGADVPDFVSDDDGDDEGEQEDEVDGDDEDEDEDDEAPEEAEDDGHDVDMVDGEEDGVSDGEEGDSEADDEDDEEEEDEGMSEGDEEVAQHAYRPVAGEDIYGRPIEGAAPVSQGKYVPPHLRRQQEERDDTTTEEYQRLKKMVNGLLNRMSESSLEPTARELRDLYRANSGQRVTTVLTDTMFKSCVSSTQVMKSLIVVYGALIASLHFCGGGGAVGAYVLETVCKHYDTRRTKLKRLLQGEQAEGVTGDEEALARELDNLVLLLACLYEFGVVSCELIYGLIRELVEVMVERDVELLLLLLRQCGQKLRSDDPGGLKDIILAVQERSAKVQAEAGGEAFSVRVRHMLDTITDLKNNKKRQSHAQESERTSRLRKLVQHARSSTSSNKGSGGRGSLAGETLHVSWQDLRSSGERGRWWRVGASWAGKSSDEPASATRSSSTAATGGSMDTTDSLQQKMLNLASKQSMNTDVRRSIFCAMMAATDYEDAFERLMRLNLTDLQQREVVRVLIDCAGQEVKFNPYYAFLAGRLCEFDQRFKFTLQLTYWDIFKLFDDPKALPRRRAVNLGKTLAQLLQKGWLNFSVLKVVDVAGLGRTGNLFFRTVLAHLLVESSDAEVLASVERIAACKEPVALAELVSLCFHRFIIRQASDDDDEEPVAPPVRKRAKQVVKLIEKMSISKLMSSNNDRDLR